MRFSKIFFLALAAPPLTLLSTAFGQPNIAASSNMSASSNTSANANTSVNASTSASTRTALPIIITRGISASDAHVGDVVYARTTQRSQLPNGVSVPSGTKVLGHVVSTSGPVKRTKLVYEDVAPVSYLTVRFDSLELAHDKLPISAYVRAMADPFESDGARTSQPSDIDPQSTTTQIGGDQLTPSQRDVVDEDGRVVGQNRRHGVYARLRNNGNCTGSETEVSVDIYSGAACGLYGFTGVSGSGIGSLRSHDLTLSSTKTASKVWRDSTALLEVASERD